MTAPHLLPLLSILIPTKNRYRTLIPVVTEILTRIADPQLEIVICDNSDPRSLEVDALVASDRRIRYLHSPEAISIVENTERGLAACNGEYLCFIGDDDLVSPHIMTIVRWLKGVGEDCLIYPPARYWWSDVVFAKESQFEHPGAFWLPRVGDTGVRRLSSKAELARVYKRGGVAYMDLPRLYHGIASRSAIERITQRFGRSVPGSSPDMALCIALAMTNESYISIGFPVSIFGASQNSGGGWTAAKKHHGRIADQKHLPGDILDNWNPKLPTIWTEQIIYPQTIHEVAKRGSVEAPISYPTLYGSLLAYEPHIASELWPLIARHVARHPTDLPKIAVKTALKLAGRARVVLRNRTGFDAPYELRNFATVSDVMAYAQTLALPTVIDPSQGAVSAS